MARIKFVKATEEQYSSLQSPDENTLYFVNEKGDFSDASLEVDGRLYLGDKLIGGGASTSPTSSVTQTPVQQSVSVPSGAWTRAASFRTTGKETEVTVQLTFELGRKYTQVPVYIEAAVIGSTSKQQLASCATVIDSTLPTQLNRAVTVTMRAVTSETDAWDVMVAADSDGAGLLATTPMGMANCSLIILRT